MVRAHEAAPPEIEPMSHEDPDDGSLLYLACVTILILYLMGVFLLVD